MGMTKQEWNNEVRAYQRRKEIARQNFENAWEAQGKESVLRRYITDPLVGAGAGLAKLPADAVEMVAPNNQFSNWWENGINEARDSMQTNSLVDSRNKFKELLSQTKGQITPEVLNYLKENPRLGLNYLAELGIPSRNILKAGALLRSTNNADLLNVLKAKGDIAFIGSQLGNDLTDSSNYLKNSHNAQASAITDQYQQLKKDIYSYNPAVNRYRIESGLADLEEAKNLRDSLPSEDYIRFRYGSAPEGRDADYMRDIAPIQDRINLLESRGNYKQAQQAYKNGSMSEFDYTMAKKDYDREQAIRKYFNRPLY